MIDCLNEYYLKTNTHIRDQFCIVTVCPNRSIEVVRGGDTGSRYLQNQKRSRTSLGVVSDRSHRNGKLPCLLMDQSNPPYLLIGAPIDGLNTVTSSTRTCTRYK